jgi:hypothetical protein
MLKQERQATKEANKQTSLRTLQKAIKLAAEAQHHN